MKYAHRVDVNQGEIVEAMRRIGAAVTPISRLGHGVADLLVSFRQQWIVMEVKSSTSAAYTFDEQKWIGLQRAPVVTVTSPMQAVRFLQALRP